MSERSVSGTASSPSSPVGVYAPSLSVEPAVGDEHADRLDRVQRDAVGAVEDGDDRLLGQTGHEAASSCRIALPAAVRAAAGEPPRAGAPTRLRSNNSGRVSATHEERLVLGPLEQVLDEVEQARVGPLDVLEHEHHRGLIRDPLEEVRHAANSARARPLRWLDAEQGEQCGSTQRARRGRARTCRPSRRFARVVASSSVSASSARARIISPSAQKVMPSP